MKTRPIQTYWRFRETRLIPEIDYDTIIRAIKGEITLYVDPVRSKWEGCGLTLIPIEPAMINNLYNGDEPSLTISGKSFNVTYETLVMLDADIEELPHYLDKTHPMFSLELKIAVDAWMAVLFNNPPRGKTGSRKQLIIKWLKDNHSNLSNQAIKRIAIMLNTDTGAPPTSK